jgi:hypothetical protein
MMTRHPIILSVDDVSSEGFWGFICTVVRYLCTVSYAHGVLLWYACKKSIFKAYPPTAYTTYSVYMQYYIINAYDTYNSVGPQKRKILYV